VTVTVYTRVRIGWPLQLRCLGLVILWNEMVAKSEGVRPSLSKKWRGGPELPPSPPKVTPLDVSVVCLNVLAVQINYDIRN